MNFQNLEKKIKNVTFLKMRKKSTISKISFLGVFKSDRPVCNHLNVNFMEKKLLSKAFLSFKKSFVCLLLLLFCFLFFHF